MYYYYYLFCIIIPTFIIDISIRLKNIYLLVFLMSMISNLDNKVLKGNPSIPSSRVLYDLNYAKDLAESFSEQKIEEPHIL